MQVATASRGILKLKRIYSEIGEDIHSMKTKGASAINDEADQTIFLGMCGVLDLRFQSFMDKFEEACEYSDSHSLEPSFPTATDRTYRDTVKSWYYEALGYKEILQRKHKLSLEQSMAALNISNTSRTSAQPTSVSTRLFLPQIKIKPFKGDLSEWPAFKQIFCALIRDERSLSDAERFHFLVSYLEGAAYDTIKHIPTIDTNFEQAWEALSKVYDDERKLACSYLECFLSFKPILGKPTAESLQQYLSKVTESITSLKNLKIPNFSDYLLCELALRSLDPSTREEFETSIIGTTYPTFDALRVFIQNRCQVLRITSGSAVIKQGSQSLGTPCTKPKSPNWFTPKSNSHALLTHLGPGSSHKYSSSSQKRSSSSQNHSSSSQNHSPSSQNHSSSSQVSSVKSPISCFICKGAHIIRSCQRFIQGTPQQRLDMLRQYPGCRNCFHPQHKTKQCQSKYRCRLCDGIHHSSLHLSTNNSSTGPTNSSLQQAVPSSNCTTAVESSIFTGSSTSSGRHGVLLGTVLAAIKDVHGNLKQYRGVLDVGSQFSFVTEQCAKDLGKTIRPFNGGISGVNHSPLNHVSGKINVTFFPKLSSASALETEAVVVPSITPPLPQVALHSSLWQDYLSYNLADPDFITPGEISFLIGADLYAEVVTGAPITIRQDGPRLINTIFGFVVVGRYHNKSSHKINNSLSLLSCDHTAALIEKFWEMEEPIQHHVMSSDDEQCEAHFVSTHRRNEQGKYIVSLPFKADQPHIIPYTSKALSRLYSLENKLAKNPQLKKDYLEFMQEYSSLGHMSVATSEPAYVIPHHPVYKLDPEGKGKLRVVFDASFKSATGSLNDHLLTGPKLQAEIGDIVLNFRRFSFVLTCDMVKMFRQILVEPSDQRYQQIAWRSDPSAPVVFYQLETVTYGLRSSPFLAQRVLQQLVLDEGSVYPDAANAILHHTYVDDIVTGCDSPEGLHNLKTQLINLLDKGGLSLSKWNTNYPPLLEDLDSSSQPVQLGQDAAYTKLLGMQWNPVSDTLSYQVEQPRLGFTKRIILSNIASLFDPLGYLTPVVFFAKAILQETWKSAVGWDDEVPHNIKIMWEKFTHELTSLSDIHIPRCLPKTRSSYQLLCFSDASERGYCAAVYLRAVHPSVASLTLLKAKSRLAPLKTQTIPRLELCGAVLLSQLLSSLQHLIKNLNINTIFCFTDSMVVLAWLKTSPHLLQTFVVNRVQQVLQATDIAWWHHIRGTDNPADVGSRGILPSGLQQHPLWWTGPTWCSLPVEEWPISSQVPALDLPELKKTPQLSLAAVGGCTEFIQFTERFSSFPRLIRVLGYMKRFIHNCKIPKHKQSRRCTGRALSAVEFSTAKFHCLRLIQKHYYPEAFSNIIFNELPLELRRLAVFIDHVGVLRVGGRLSNAPVPTDHKYPILLPSRSHITTLIVAQYHHENHHAGPSTVLSSIRQQFWVPRGRNLIKQYKSRCVTCIRFSKATRAPFMGDLPSSRFNSVRPFANTGIDFAGPFLCKTSPRRNAPSIKCYLCLFICLSTRAVHLELATALTVEAFLDAFDRFVARRSLPSHIYSDCGTNFVGAAGYLRDLLDWYNREDTQSSIIHHTAHLSVNWSFNPPSAPHFGGSWESAVKSAKSLLYKSFGQQPYLQEELSTMFTKVEGLLNSRPLLPLSDSPDDAEPLTPGHFLVGQPLNILPEQDLAGIPYNRLSRWQLLRERVQYFWDRWRTEYLSSLQIREKWHRRLPNLKIGDLVIIWDDRTAVSHWPMGRIINVHPGVDGTVRVVTIKTARGELKRPTAKLLRLPVTDEPYQSRDSSTPI